MGACAGPDDRRTIAIDGHAASEDATSRWWGEREVDFPARPLAPFDPQYPPQARDRGLEGDALLLVYVRADGRVIGTKDVGSDRLEFARAAADAIREVGFHPATRHREPVNSTVTIRVRFRLD